MSSWRFSKFSAWLCAGATIIRCLLEICSVNSRFIPLVWDLIGRVRFFLLFSRDSFGGVELVRSFGYPWEEQWFLVELQVSLEVAVFLNFLAKFRAISSD